MTVMRCATLPEVSSVSSLAATRWWTRVLKQSPASHRSAEPSRSQARQCGASSRVIECSSSSYSPDTAQLETGPSCPPPPPSCSAHTAVRGSSGDTTSTSWPGRAGGFWVEPR